MPQPSIRFLQRLALPGAMLACSIVPARAATCPVTDLEFNAGGVFTSAAAAFDTVASATKELGYDAAAGSLRLEHDDKFTTFVRIHDTFVVGRVTPGTPVLAVLELVADGEVSTSGCGGANCWGYLGVRVVTDDAAGQEIDEHNVFTGSQVAHADLGVPMLFIAGQPKEIAIELNAIGSAEHTVTGTATYRFTALPSGATVTSCRGYVQSPTPAQSATWGGVKAAYR